MAMASGSVLILVNPDPVNAAVGGWPGRLMSAWTSNDHGRPPSAVRLVRRPARRAAVVLGVCQTGHAGQRTGRRAARSLSSPGARYSPPVTAESIVQAVTAIVTPLAAVAGFFSRKRRLRTEIRENLNLVELLEKNEIL